MKNDEGLYSKKFDDIYFSPLDGIGESKAVFLDGINAPNCWKDKKIFTVSELGFGSGLNFLLTAKLWCETTSSDQKLIYYSTEKYPLDKNQIKEAIKWQELKPYLLEMLESYPNNNQLFDRRVKLNILIGDSLEQLKKQNFKSNAWFMDGFAPSKNPAMWSEEILKEMAKLSKEGARVATFTAAGFVRRGLEKVRFQMEKRPGFGKKREMLSGILDIKKAAK